jgi:hypothetical protein
MDRTSNTESFVASGRSLEDAFFQKQDSELIACRSKLTKLAETKEALAAVSGIKNAEVLEHLVAMNVRPETLAALAAVPLVEVVWADGHVDDKEKKVVLDFAAAQGITPGTIAHELLERWLIHRPGDALMVAWQHYVEALCGRLSGSDRRVLEDELLHNVRAAAAASGGFLGFGAVSEQEKAAIAKLESSFRAK